jgi:hypothetical protein
LAVDAQAHVHLLLRLRQSMRGDKSTHIFPFQLSPSTRFHPILKTYPAVIPSNERHSNLGLRLQRSSQAKAFEAGVLSARVARLLHARHEVFSSNEEDVLREMNAFIGSLP